MCFFTESSEVTAKIDKIKIKDSAMTLNITRSNDGTANDVMVSWIFLIKVKKADIENVAEIKTKHTYVLEEGY